jgi:predicted dehydrogenase
MSLVTNPDNIRLALLGMVDGNGHPYSWGAIINGRYDKTVMEACGYPVIPQYLGAQPPENLGIDGATVTHVWCDDADDAAKVSAAIHAEHVVDRPEDVIGQVDAVIIPTDIGSEHVQRARPFIEAGLPVFVDKPMVDNAEDLRQFIDWQQQGKAILSTSAMRYAREFADLRSRCEPLEPRVIVMTMCKSWERYGIHALEGVYPFLQPGDWLAVSNTGDEKANMVHILHRSGVDVMLAVVGDLYGSYSHMTVYGKEGFASARAEDTFFMFKAQLVAFVEYLRTGQLPFDFDQTVELMKIIIAAIRSRNDGGRRVLLSEIL